MALLDTPALWSTLLGARILLVAHTKASPTREAWQTVMAEVRSTLRPGGELRTLVFTDGGAPSSEMRAELNQASKAREHRIGVVSDAASVRFVASSIALFNRTIKTFAPAQWRAASTHLGLSPEEVATTEAALRELLATPHGSRFATVAAALQGSPGR